MENMANDIAFVLMMAVIVLTVAFVLILVFKWLWNITMPDVFGISEVTFWPAYCLADTARSSTVPIWGQRSWMKVPKIRHSNILLAVGFGFELKRSKKSSGSRGMSSGKNIQRTVNRAADQPCITRSRPASLMR